jgi:methyl-accepting chemotaxis protein
MRRALAEERGLAGLVLVIVIAWALAAVIMLIGTLTNARQIDDRVKIINSQVSPINKDLNNVKLVFTTNRIASGIRTAAAPLSGQLTQVNDAAKGINRTAGRILDTAGTINGTVTSIHGTVGEIHTTVASIHSNVLSINSTAHSILARAQSINGSVHSINASARSINATVHSIQSRVGTILATAHSIDNGGSTGGVSAINTRAATGIVTVRGIETDLAAVLAQVGLGLTPSGPDNGTPSNAKIEGHANSIDCARLINLLGATQYCGK